MRMLAIKTERTGKLGRPQGAICAVGLLLFACCFLGDRSLKGAEPDPLQLQQEFTQSLEQQRFADAATQAEKEPDASRRDRLLGRVVLAQFMAGDKQGAEATSNKITNPQTRASTAQGGGGADFTALIDLIQTVIEPDSWDTLGGNGSVSSFPSGVYLDVSALSATASAEAATLEPSLAAETTTDKNGLPKKAPSAGKGHANKGKAPQDLTSKSLPLAAKANPLDQPTLPAGSKVWRAVSLTRLERAVALQFLAARPLDKELLTLANVDPQYVVRHAKTGEILLIGPECTTGYPMRLELLVNLARQLHRKPNTPFGCSITPKTEGLQAVQEYVTERQTVPLVPGERSSWLNELRTRLGKQDVSVFGLDARTEVARVLVAADYHMKLIGMGLAPGPVGMKSYLRRAADEGDIAQLETIRWWFTLGDGNLQWLPAKSGLFVDGFAPQVQSENEFLTAVGERIHTGESSAANQGFATEFTERFAEIATKYPGYWELRNVFRLAVLLQAVQQLEAEKLVKTLDSHAEVASETLTELPSLALLASIPTRIVEYPMQLPPVVNAVKAKQGLLVAGVSGGVEVSASKIETAETKSTNKGDRSGKLSAEDWKRIEALRNQTPAAEAWFWE